MPDSTGCRRLFALQQGIEFGDTLHRRPRNQPNFSCYRIVHPHQDHVCGDATYRYDTSTFLAKRKPGLH